MALMYLLALIPMVVGAIIWTISHNVVWFEWLIATAAAFLVSGIFHFAVLSGMTADTEIWSGMVRTAHHTPRWVAEWTEFETYTDSDGNTHTRLVTRRETHHPRWWVTSSIGDISISQGEYSTLRNHFGDESKKRGHRPNFDSGDRYDYQLVNVNNYHQPIHDDRRWTNRVKAAPSVFSFPPVPESVSVFEYPEVNRVFRSNRLLGTASRNIDVLEFDRMCGWLGPAKKVNVIIIGFGEDTDQSIAQYQEAHWIGGKKNDIVLCYGGRNGDKPGWSYVFGWTDEALVKRNLETILITNEINNDILPLIDEEIRENYKIKDWSEFDYLTISPPTWSYLVLLLTMLLTQGGLWVYFHHNNVSKDSHGLQRVFGKRSR